MNTWIRYALCLLVMFAVGLSWSQTLMPFEADDDIRTIREKIKQNGYSFQVRDYETEVGRSYFVPGLFPVESGTNLKSKSLNIRTIDIPEELPESFDWRNVDGKSYIGPIRDQMQAGTCGMFAGNAAAESVFNIHANLTDENCIDLSESYVSWTLGQVDDYSEYFSGWIGANVDFYNLTALTKFGLGTGLEGTCFEKDFPYQDIYPGDDYSEKSKSYPRIYVDNWFRVFTPNDEDTTDAIKAAILKYGCVVTAIYVTNAFYNYAGGVYEDTCTEPNATPYYYSSANHAISLVGWDDHPPEGGGGCWILRNSWGTEWGEDGYMRIRYKSARVNLYPCVLYLDESSIHAYTTGVEDAGEDYATFSGYVKTGGAAVSYYFEYGKDETFNQKTETKTISYSSGQSIYRATETVNGLVSGHTYDYRLVIVNPENGENDIKGLPDSFTLKEPSVETDRPVVRDNYLQTTFIGAFETNNLPTNVYFEYGETPEYGNIKSVSPLLRDQEITLDIDNLLPDTTYYYRWTMNNGIASASSDEAIFKSSKNIFRNGFEANEDNPHFRISYSHNGEMYFDHSYSWYNANGNLMPKQNPSSAFNGKQNSIFSFDPRYEFEDDYTEEIGIFSYATSQSFCLSQFDTAYLSFYYAQPAWGDDQDELRVYYQSSPDGEWILLPGAEYMSNVTEWTHQVLELPDLSESYRIRFETVGNFGWGVLLDEVEILQTSETGVGDWSLR